MTGIPSVLYRNPGKKSMRALASSVKKVYDGEYHEANASGDGPRRTEREDGKLQLRHAIWDFDGMLFDSYPHMATAFQKVLAARGETATLAQILLPMKRSVGLAFQVFGLNEAEQRQYARFEEQLELDPPVRPFAGVPALLRAFCAGGGRHYIYSHRNATVFLYLDQYGIRDCFADCVTGDQGFPGKPAPDALLYLLRKHGIQPDEALMLGDREIDVQCGHNAGMAACLFDEFARRPATEAEYCVTEIRGLYSVLGLTRPAETEV